MSRSVFFKPSLWLAFGLSACSASNEDTPNATRTGSAKGFASPPAQAGDAGLYAPITEPGVPVAPGSSVDLNNHKGIPNHCLEGTELNVPQQEGYFSFDATYSREDIDRMLGTSVSGGVKFLAWGASARANFSHTSRSQSYGLNYLVFAYNKHHSKVFLPTGRKEAWQHATPEEWNASCGSGYVAAQDFGSMLIVRFSLNLDKNESNSAFSSSASGRFLSFASLRASISANQKINRAKGTLSVSAIQIGGKPEELGKILKRDTDGPGTIESFALCDISEVSKCLEGLRSIEDYISKSFPKQIEDKENGGGAVLTTYPFKFPKTMGGDYNPGLDQYVLKARKQLGELYEQEMNDIVSLQSYSRKDDSEFKEILEKAKQNVAQIREAAELCYDTETYKNCAKKTEELRIACAETIVPQHINAGPSGEANSGHQAGE